MIGYLVKPIEKVSLRTALELAVQNAYLKEKEKSPKKPDTTNQFLSNECLFIKKSGAFHKLTIASIAFIQADGNYCDIVTSDGSIFVSRTPLSKMEEILPSQDFMRTHRQYIIRLDKIDMVDIFEGFVKIADKTIPISRNKRKELADMLNMLT